MTVLFKEHPFQNLRTLKRVLERRGLLIADPEYLYPNLESGSSLDHLHAASVAYHIAIGPHADRKALVLYSLPLLEDTPDHTLLAKVAGFSLHAATVCEAWQQSRLERLCRYVTRPPMPPNASMWTTAGGWCISTNTPFCDGLTHVVLEPLDFIARLAALVPRPRLNLTHFHGIFALNFKHRNRIVPHRTRGKIDADQPTVPMSWMQRLEHVFAIDIESGTGLALNRHIVISANYPKAFDRMDGAIYLESGFHSVNLRYFQRGGAAAIKLWWKPPGATEWEIVPEHVLYPPVSTDETMVRQ